ncbi:MULTISPECIES: hypothetical protein [Afipia]|jgi:hypothetical protein|uniref:hypothetical protein n=1 Tax=Afipia TaxID=1033 RepID=UPI0012E26DB1|nr:MULTISPECIES: hypothetical protein [Afipia]MBE0705405.1 hypothetical protein [Afipia sp.]
MTKEKTIFPAHGFMVANTAAQKTVQSRHRSQINATAIRTTRGEDRVDHKTE